MHAHIKIQLNIPKMLCLSMAHVSFCVACMALHCRTHGILPDIPEYTRLTSSLQAAEKPEEGVLFFTYWRARLDRSFGTSQRFLRKYERATSCNQAVSVTTRVQRNSELPLKMPPDHSSEEDSQRAVDVCVCIRVCVCLFQRLKKKSGQANSCSDIFLVVLQPT